MLIGCGKWIAQDLLDAAKQLSRKTCRRHVALRRHSLRSGNKFSTLRLLFYVLKHTVEEDSHLKFFTCRRRSPVVALIGLGMPHTKCPSCRKIQQVSPKLMRKDIGCMGERCHKSFKAEEYRLHSGPLSRVIFWFVIAFAVFMAVRWVWENKGYMIQFMS